MAGYPLARKFARKPLPQLCAIPHITTHTENKMLTMLSLENEQWSNESRNDRSSSQGLDGFYHWRKAFYQW